MRARFTQSFKIQAVEKALSRSDATSLREVSDSLGVGQSTLQKWIVKSRNQEFESISDNAMTSVGHMTKEIRPQDWSSEDKLTMVIRCATLDDEGVSKLCREQGLYLHHIQQWKQDFVSGAAVSSPIKDRSDARQLRHENKTLKKELNRKEKALAETAALLVLQKKVSAIWGNDEDGSQ
jgi:transposase-like protein